MLANKEAKSSRSLRETNGGGSGTNALSLLRGIAGRMLIRMLALALALALTFAARAEAHLVVLKLPASGSS